MEGGVTLADAATQGMGWVLFFALVGVLYKKGWPWLKSKVDEALALVQKSIDERAKEREQDAEEKRAILDAHAADRQQIHQRLDQHGEILTEIKDHLSERGPVVTKLTELHTAIGGGANADVRQRRSNGERGIK